MIFEFKEPNGGGIVRIVEREPVFTQVYYQQRTGFDTNSIAWNRGLAQSVVIDEISYTFGANTVLPLMLNQSFRFERPGEVTLVQFNRDFYCIFNHDAEVGCAGFLFFGPSPVMFVTLEALETDRLAALMTLFAEEIQRDDTTRPAMLRMLLVQYIITLTRLSKKQYVQHEATGEQFDLLRRYYMLVEMHFRKEKQVKFYAAQLHRSPKTISNVFARLSKKTPLEIIHNRVVTEAKRLIYYTDKSVKEIAAELGFDDVSHFTKFIKGYTSLTPSQLKKAKEPAEAAA